jgi:drug/metabolite transporter (DMT)-like permease
MVSYFWLALYVAMIATGNMLFKHLGLSMQGKPVAEGFLIVARSPTLYAALGLYGLATFLWIWILSKFTLSQAYPWLAVPLGIVPLLAWAIFDERMSPSYWLGIGFVIVGVLLTQHAAHGS